MATVFSTIIKNFREEVDRLGTYVASGRAENFAEYKEITGRIRGIGECIDYVTELERNQLENDDDDD